MKSRSDWHQHDPISPFDLRREYHSRHVFGAIADRKQFSRHCERAAQGEKEERFERACDHQSATIANGSLFKRSVFAGTGNPLPKLGRCGSVTTITLGNKGQKTHPFVWQWIHCLCSGQYCVVLTTWSTAKPHIHDSPNPNAERGRSGSFGHNERCL